MTSSGRPPAAATALLPVDRRTSYRRLTDDELLAALRYRPRMSAFAVQRMFHVPGRAVDWWALKAQLARLATEGRLTPVLVRTTERRRPWIGWELVP
jgi:hypothetical protein